ncbi:echinoderm microtubule-associated protein-like CG42247 isoform X1 [Drosophila nasuta]|uniref:echinoderm microtubule-associated protein-like CG42247 isoform X1 n=1 Tax=Drosophila nasuta TaxID=42062 RepID=UPI00295EF144|nr:echinoderm microtubule-associated protein-like CG42247 isoform X1 [Drosophila nasuta]
MSNEENDYLDGMSAHRNGNVDGDGDGDGNGGDGKGGSGGGDDDDGGVAAANDESAVHHGGKTMPQISSNSQLEGNVSPTFTQTTGQFDDNDNQLNHHNASQLGHNNHHPTNDSNRNSPTKSPTARGNSSFQIQPQSAHYDDDDDDLAAGDLHSTTTPGGGGGAGAAAGRAGAGGGSSQLPDYWQQRNGGTAGHSATAAGGGGIQSGHQSRAISPSYLDNMSETSEQPPVVPLVRSKSRPEISSAAASRYSNLSYWKARRVVFYRNGDPFFPGVELRYRPGRDVTSLDNLLDKISPKMDLPRGARYVFSMDGDRKYHLEELEDGAFYVVSSFKAFKPASYGKKNGMWYASPGNQGWGSKPASRKPSIMEADLGTLSTTSGSIKRSAGRVIRIINNLDHSVQCRVLLNLRTSQPFEEVLEDLGQVLKINGAKKMYTGTGQEVRSFSQLRNEFADVDTFYLATGTALIAGSPIRRSRSRPSVVAAAPILPTEELPKVPLRGTRPRSKSRPRILYAPESEILRPNGEYTMLDIMKEEPTKVTIRGLRRTFYPPVHHAPADNSPPDKKLQLQWVHGYRGIDARRNLWVLPTGELLYYVAAVAVLFDRDEDAQRHYIGHTEDIMCMDVHPSRELVASGQKAGRDRKSQAHVRIWSTESLQTLYVFGMGELDTGVTAVAFSQLNGGSYILAVDSGRESILSVWQWQWGHLLGKVATLQEGLSGAAFHPLDDNLIITHGRGHLAFWHRRKDGFFERTDIVKQPSRSHITSVQFEPDGDVITADSDGFITIYSVDSDGAYFVRTEFEAHNKGIGCLIMLGEGTLLSGGEKDRKIAAWDSLQNYKKIADTKLPEAAGGVRTIYPQRPGRNDGNIYVGTTRNNILEGSLQRRFTQVVFGHGRQLWGLAAHPEDELYATAGHDKHVALWRKNKLIWTIQTGYECVALAFHPFGTALAAGSTEGHLLVINCDNGSVMLTLRVCGSPLNCVSYNQVGDMIAMGSQNGSIYLFRVSRDGFSYKKVNKIRGSQPLTHLDWSMDGNFVQTVTIDFDLLFWDAKSLSPERSPIAMKDVKWLTSNCTVGFLVAGQWSNRYYSSANTIIATCSRSAAHDMLASGDAEGYLRLYRYPCISPRAEFHESKVYSGMLACARFLCGDHTLITVGGTDASLMVWDIVEE